MDLKPLLPRNLPPEVEIEDAVAVNHLWPADDHGILLVLPEMDPIVRNGKTDRAVSLRAGARVVKEDLPPHQDRGGIEDVALIPRSRPADVDDRLRKDVPSDAIELLFRHRRDSDSVVSTPLATEVHVVGPPVQQQVRIGCL